MKIVEKYPLVEGGATCNMAFHQTDVYERNPMSVKLPICISDNKVGRLSFSACYTMAPSLT